MAAYGSLVSVMQIINQIQLHPRPPISLDEKQVESLTKAITFLQDFLEGYSHVGYTEEEDVLESHIAEAAYAAEDVIESYIVDQILARSINQDENISSIQFYQGLQRVIKEMDLIKMELVEMKEKAGVQDQPRIIKSISDAAGSSRSTLVAQKGIMVGFDDVLYEMLDKITAGGLDRQIIPIVGMGGIGKTTLARNVYENPLVEQRFDVCAWSAITQNHCAIRFFRQVLEQVDKGNEVSEYSGEDELGEQVYKYLIGRRYLIVMDDMWSIEAWEKVMRFFPDNGNGSRIVITTRLSNLASQLNGSYSLVMKFLDEAASWNLFSETVFGEEIVPLELEDIGKKIAEGCKGLPLSVVVIGGLLSKSERTRENWEFVEENLNSIVNLEDNERCLQILYMSYNNLPVYIKPCFLYIAIFHNNLEFPIFFLVNLWVAEGLLKPIQGKSLEEVGEEHLKELVDRNLLLVERRNHYGKLKSCRMHDLLGDLCLREARKLKFLCVLGELSIHDISQGINSPRRIQCSSLECATPLVQSLEYSASLVRSLVGIYPDPLTLSNFRLLKVFLCYFEEQSSQYYEEIFLWLVNLRFLCVDRDEHPLPRIPSSISFFWNLQTLFLVNVGYDYVVEISKMPLLRHVITNHGTLDAANCLPHSLSGDTDEVLVLENLQTLAIVSNLSFGEGVLKRIPNVTKLNLYYNDASRAGADYYLNNLGCLHKLQALRLHCSYYFQILAPNYLVPEIAFPHSLKKLTLQDTKLPWENMKAMIGSLPLLQVLKLKEDSFTGNVWETFEDQFSSLKFLLIDRCGLECWMTDSSHFPCLEHLVLRNLIYLTEIPWIIGDIPTLESIVVENCGDLVVDSATRIVEEQESLGNEGIRLEVRH